MSINVTYSRARANLAKLLDEVSLNREIVVVSRKKAENVALISESELSALLETVHLLRSPKNAQRLLTALLRANGQEGKPQTLVEMKKEFGLEG